MNKIIKKEKLNSVTTRFVIEAPRVANKAQAGQFVIIRIDEKGERIPLTICDFDKRDGLISIVFQEAGKTTKKLAALNEAGPLLDLVGPLGNPTMIDKTGKIVFLGGGIGIAELYPVARLSKEKGNKNTIIIGARSKEFIILENELESVSNELIITTDDGSYGKKGLVTNPLECLLKKAKFDLCYCVGPDIMMKAVSDLTRPFNLKTIVSLDANMVDATGMCGTCRVSVGGETKFSCVDGPEFDGHLVDFDEFMARQARFKEEEAKALELFEKNEETRSKRTHRKF